MLLAYWRRFLKPPETSRRYLKVTQTNTDTSDDYVHGGSGPDRIYGEGGNDTIDTGQRQEPDPKPWKDTKEIIDCGAGASDAVFFDQVLDVVKNCEIKHGLS